MRGGSHELRAGVADTGGALTVWVSATPRGKGPPLHVHEHEDELFFVTHGEYELVCGAAVEIARAGALMFLPRRTPHTFRSLGDDGPGGLFQVCVPGGMEHYFAAIDDSDADTERGRELRRIAGERFGLRFPDDPRALLPGAESEPSYSVRSQSEGPRLGPGESRLVPRLALSETAGRIAFDELHVAPGAAWVAPASDDWRLFHLLAGELEFARPSAASRCPVGATLTVAPGTTCSGACGDSAARLIVVTVPPLRG